LKIFSFSSIRSVFAFVEKNKFCFDVDSFLLSLLLEFLEAIAAPWKTSKFSIKFSVVLSSGEEALLL